ncbi:MAG: chorismate mutase [Treponema sp.]|nr:chorismate mutase [Treponema sp.]
MSKRLYGVRGATGAENTKESISRNVCEMCLEIVKKNNLRAEDIVSIQFTQTGDLDEMNPAAALRKGQSEFDFSSVPLFCSQEPNIKNSPEKMVRVLFTAYFDFDEDKDEGDKDGKAGSGNDKKIKHVYINGGEKLRPDFAS